MALSIGDMDSGNSASMQSSSGGGTGGDEEYDSRGNESISVLFNASAGAGGVGGGSNSTTAAAAQVLGGLFNSQLQPQPPQPSGPSTYHDHSHSFDPLSHSNHHNIANYFHTFSSSSLPFPSSSSSSTLMADSLRKYHHINSSGAAGAGLLNLESVWAKTLRSDPTSESDHDQIMSSMMMMPNSGNNRSFLQPDHQQFPAGSSFDGKNGQSQVPHGVGVGGSSSSLAHRDPQNQSQQQQNLLMDSNMNTSRNGPLVRNPKKRSRASRRAPTTVLATDTTNFRAMVQEFTGIPVPPPFTSSPFSRTRLDLFSGGGGGTNTGNFFLDPSHQQQPSYLLKPFAQKPPSFLSSSTAGSTSNNANSMVPPPSSSSTDHLGSLLKQNMMMNQMLPAGSLQQSSSFLHQGYPPVDHSSINPGTSSHTHHLQLQEEFKRLNDPAASGGVGGVLMPGGASTTDGDQSQGCQNSSTKNWSHGLGFERLSSGSAAGSCGQSDPTSTVNGGGCNITTTISQHHHLHQHEFVSSGNENINNVNTNTSTGMNTIQHHHHEEVRSGGSGDGGLINLQNQSTSSKGMLESWICSTE